MVKGKVATYSALYSAFSEMCNAEMKISYYVSLLGSVLALNFSIDYPKTKDGLRLQGKLMIGESAGAIICAPSIQYIEQMDEKPEDYSQEDDAGLDLIDFYVLPHYLTAPFKKVTEKIMTEFSDLNLCPINNRQGIVIDGEGSKVICKD